MSQIRPTEVIVETFEYDENSTFAQRFYNAQNRFVKESRSKVSQALDNDHEIPRRAQSNRRTENRIGFLREQRTTFRVGRAVIPNSTQDLKSPFLIWIWVCSRAYKFDNERRKEWGGITPFFCLETVMVQTFLTKLLSLALLSHRLPTMGYRTLLSRALKFARTPSLAQF